MGHNTSYEKNDFQTRQLQTHEMNKKTRDKSDHSHHNEVTFVTFNTYLNNIDPSTARPHAKSFTLFQKYSNFLPSLLQWPTRLAPARISATLRTQQPSPQTLPASTRRRPSGTRMSDRTSRSSDGRSGSP